jgi:hypothetical protein
MTTARCLVLLLLSALLVGCAKVEAASEVPDTPQTRVATPLDDGLEDDVD